MMRGLCLLSAVAVAGALFAAEKPYTCSLKVENPKTVSKTDSDKGGNNNGGGFGMTRTKTTRRTMTWATRVSFRGKEFPSDVKLCFFCFGDEDGTAKVLAQETQEVVLDAKGDFKVDLVSPEAVLTKTKSSGNRGNNNGNGSSGSTTKGTRISGCVVQLMVGNEVVRSYASKPTWAKLARKTPLPEAEILGFR